MIECSSCHTLNPDAERACLVCGTALATAAPKATPTLGMARCPAGHPIDPSWKICPYCERQEAGGAAAAQRSTRLDVPPEPSTASRRTRLEGEAAWPERALASPLPTPRPTRLEPDEPARGRRTVLQDSISPPTAPSFSPAPPSLPASVGVAPAPAGAAVRRLLGVLAAPDLGSGGSVFAVRGGRNTIGAERSNDIVLTGDSEVSGDHAVILHRNGTFHLADRLSTNGTWVNGEEVPATGTVPLNDRDRLRCGRTELVFLVIEPAPSSTAAMDQD